MESMHGFRETVPAPPGNHQADLLPVVESAIAAQEDALPRNNASKESTEESYSTSQLSSIVSRFSPRQEAIVKQMGFGFVLSLPTHTTTDRRFLAWIFSKIRIGVSGSLTMDPGGGRQPIKISDKEVSEILALPSEGIVLMQGAAKKANPNWSKVSSMICQGRGMKGTSVNAFRAGRALERATGKPMTEQEEEQFAAAVLIFVVDSLLAPRPKGRTIDGSVVQAARKAKAAAQYNWADYVLQVIAAVTPTIQEEMHYREPEDLHMGGCWLLLEVLYLSKYLDVPPTLRIEGAPLVASYTEAIIIDLIQEDLDAVGSYELHAPQVSTLMSYLSGGGGIDERRLKGAGAIKVTELAAMLEMYGDNVVSRVLAGMTDLLAELAKNKSKQDAPDVPLNDPVQPNHDTAASVRSAIGDPADAELTPDLIEGAAHLLDLIQSAEKSRGAAESNTNFSNQALSMEGLMGKANKTSVPLDTQVQTPHPIKLLTQGQGMSSQPSAFLRSDLMGNQVIPSECKGFRSRKRSRSVIEVINQSPQMVGPPAFDPSPPGSSNTVPLQTTTLQLSSAYYQSPDLVVRKSNDFYASGSSSARPLSSASALPRSSYVINEMYASLDENTITKICQWVRSKQASLRMNRIWIHCQNPAEITIQGDELLSQIRFALPMNSSVMSAIMYLFKEQDDIRHALCRTNRSRHFLNAFWAEQCVGLNIDTFHSLCAASFQDPYLDYNPSKCDMIICPVFQGRRWHMYIFKHKESLLNIIDPVVESESLFENLSQQDLNFVGKRLIDGLGSCLKNLCNYKAKASKLWIIRKVNLTYSDDFKCSARESGLIAALMAREFDGNCIKGTWQKDTITSKSKEVMAGLSSLRGNNLKPWWKD